MSVTSIPKVSVVVPFYNSVPYVLNAIIYLKRQTLGSFEAILVDDGSDDTCLSKVRDSIVDDDRFRLISQSHSGAGEARNLGFEKVRSEYVIFLDSDDVFNKSLLEKMYSSAITWGSDVVLCDANSETNSLMSILQVDHLEKEWANAAELRERLFQITSSVPWNKLIRTSLIQKYNLKFLTLQNSNDITFIYSVLAVANRISWVTEPLVQYGGSNTNSLQQLKDKDPTNIVLALEGLLDNLKTFGNFSYLKDSFFKMVIDHILWNFDTLKVTASRKQLLYSYIESGLYREVLSQRETSQDPEFLAFCEEIDLLRSAFYKRKKQPTEIISTQRKRKFTVIIPFFNGERFISIPLQSLKNQTFDDFSVFLVNDGSRDNAREIALKIIGNDPRFQIIDQDNQGLSNSRNLGLNLANSEYIIFLDSDDGLVPDCLDKLNENIESFKPEIIFFEAKTVNSFSSEDKEATKRCSDMNKYYARKGEYGELLTGPEVMYQACVNNEFIASACLSVVKRSFIEKHEIRFIPNILHEDNPYTFEILLKSKSVLVLKDKFYLRTVRPESITTKKKTIRNVWGYYVSFQKTQELLRSLHNRELLTEDQALAFQKISFSFLRFAQNIWKNIPYPRLFLSFIQKDQRIVFEKLIATIEMNTTQLNLSKKEIKLIELKRKYLGFIRYILRKLGIK